MARKSTDIKLIVRAEVEKAINDLKRTEREIDNMGKTGSSISPVFTALKGGVIGFITAIGIKEVAGFTLELAKLGDAARQVEDPFQKISTTLGKDFNGALEELRKSVRGAASDLELMQRASQAVDAFTSAGVDANEAWQATQETMDFLFRYSVKFGKDFNSLMRTVFTGLQRGSVQFLDDVGIMIDQNSKEFEGLDAVEKKARLVQMALEQMAEKNKLLGEVQEGSNVASLKQEAAFKNLQAAIGKIIDEPVTDFFNVTTWAMNAATDAINRLETQFISLQLAVLNRINPSFEKLVQGLDEHSKKVVDSDEKVKSFIKVWADANIELAKGQETIKLISNLYGENSEKAEAAKEKNEELAKRSHDAFLLLQQRVVELRKELGKPLDLGGGKETPVIDLEALKKAQEEARRLAEIYENAQKLIRESGEETVQAEIDRANKIIENYENLHKKRVALDQEQIEMVKDISKTNISEAIAVTDYLLENWEFTEEEKKRLLELRKEYIRDAAEEEIRQAEKVANQVRRIFQGPMQALVSDLLYGVKKSKDIWSDFIDYMISELNRFLAEQAVLTFFQLILNAIGGSAGAVNVGSMFLKPAANAVSTESTNAGFEKTPLPPNISLPKLTSNLPVPTFMQPGTISNITTDNSQRIDMGQFQLIVNGPVYGEDATLLNSVKKLQREHQYRLGRSLNKQIL